MNPPPETLLDAQGLDKSYHLGKRSVHVLRNVSLTVARGEFLALCGASGAGKSTLLHLLGALDTPDQGSIQFAGLRLDQMSQRDLSRFRNRRIGFIFQAYHLLPELDALENVCLPGRMDRRDAPTLAKKGRELLARVGLADRFDHRPYELSGGEQQRVAIARALINDPELILADEPTGNLDSRTGAEITDLLCSLRDERRATLIIATHSDEIATRAPRLLHLADGRIT